MTDHAGGLRLARRLRKAVTLQQWPPSAGQVTLAASFGGGTSEAERAL